ncbi:MAG: hypothetical protein ABRQ23_00295 [Syntrophomonadaceae bacterium]
MITGARGAPKHSEVPAAAAAPAERREAQSIRRGGREGIRDRLTYCRGADAESGAQAQPA